MTETKHTLLPPSGQITVSLLGDLMLGRSFDTAPVYPWGPCVLEALKDTLVCGNLETSITAATTPYPDKTFNFKVAPTVFEKLLPPDVPIVLNLANNHILDYQVQGLQDTIAALDHLGIAHTGAGMELKQAQRPAMVQFQGLRFGLLGFGDHDGVTKRGDAWASTSTVPGMNYLNIDQDDCDAKHDCARKDALTLVQSVAKEVDVLIIYLHHGSNWVPKVSKTFTTFAHQLIDAGAKIVANTSAHHLLPIETYRNSIIFPALGDFIDDYAVNVTFRNDLTVLAQVTFDRDGQIVSSSAYPARIEAMVTHLLDPDEDDYREVRKRIDR